MSQHDGSGERARNRAAAGAAAAIRRFTAVIAALLMAACGGGGDGGLNVDISPSPLAASVYEGQLPAQLSVFAQVSGTTSATEIYVLIDDDSGTFPPGLVPVLPAQGTLRFEVRLTTAADLAIGEHAGSLSARICSDPGCDSVIESVTLPYSVTVKAPEVTRLDPQPLNTSLIQGESATVKVFVNGARFGSPAYARLVDTSEEFDVSQPIEMSPPSNGFEYELNLPLRADLPDEHRVSSLQLEICKDPQCSVSYGTQALSYSLQILRILAGKPGDAGRVDGIAGSARFDYPSGITRDGAGNLYIQDAVVRRIAADGTVSSLPPDNVIPLGVLADAAGNVLVAELVYDTSQVRLAKRSPDGSSSLFADFPDYTEASIDYSCLAFDAQGSVYTPAIGSGYAYDKLGSFYRLNSDGSRQQIAYQQLYGPRDIVIDSHDTLMTIDDRTLRKFNTEGAPLDSLPILGITSTSALALDSQDRVYVIDWTNRKVFRLLESGYGVEVIPSGARYSNGASAFIHRMLIDPNGRAYFTDSENHVVLTTQLQ